MAGPHTLDCFAHHLLHTRALSTVSMPGRNPALSTTTAPHQSVVESQHDKQEERRAAVLEVHHDVFVRVDGCRGGTHDGRGQNKLEPGEVKMWSAARLREPVVAERVQQKPDWTAGTWLGCMRWAAAALACVPACRYTLGVQTMCIARTAPSRRTLHCRCSRAARDSASRHAM